MWFETSPRQLLTHKIDEPAKGAKHVAIYFISLDDDAQPIFHFRQKIGDSHRIKFRQRSKKLGRVGKSGGALRRDAQYIRQQRADVFSDGGKVRLHVSYSFQWLWLRDWQPI
jgi:hypothetical protein